MKLPKAGGGWRSILYTLKKSREAGGVWRMVKALRTRNTCKTCALGMGGQRGGMVNEQGNFPEVCKKSIQAMAADMQGQIPEHFFNDNTLEKLASFSPRELEAAGRITKPLYVGPLDNNYKEISWEDALEKIAKQFAKVQPDETFFYFSGRSSNEAGFLLQLFARIYGTNNINNCSYFCHQASGVGLTSVTGSGTATIMLEDVDKCDMLFLIGGNPASNHPRFMRSLMELKRRGGKVIIVNPLREVGLVKFKVPSDVRSLLFGSTIADVYVKPHIGGDIALLQGVVKALIEHNDIDSEFVNTAAEGWEDYHNQLDAIGWEEIEQSSGVNREIINQVAKLYTQSKNTIFAWTMGITHHKHGVENVQMIANLAMCRGMLGKPGSGLLPLRGHSNVQGIGSIGATPALKKAVFDKLENHFGVTLPTTPGMDTLACMKRADEGGVKLAWNLGGNLYGSNPDSIYAHKALSKINMSVYLSTTLNTGHIHGRGRETIILPVLARDEEAQTTTQESMFNYVRLSDGGRSRHEGPRSEVEVIAEVAERTFEKLNRDTPLDWQSMRAHKRIREAIADIIPGYEAIGRIDNTKEEFHIKGRTFHEPSFPTETGKANFHVVNLPKFDDLKENQFRLMTIRSEGQFNTVVYEEEDIYRGQERRDVILLSCEDVERLGFAIDHRVTVKSAIGEMSGILVREFDIRPGNAAMYYPEVNILVPRSIDAKSKTPAFKNVLISIEV